MINACHRSEWIAAEISLEDKNRSRELLRQILWEEIPRE